MQHFEIGNFRARLRRMGYTSISIKRAKKKFTDQEIYKVVAYEPLTYSRCERYMTIMDMFMWR